MGTHCNNLVKLGTLNCRQQLGTQYSWVQSSTFLHKVWLVTYWPSPTSQMNPLPLQTRHESTCRLHTLTTKCAPLYPCTILITLHCLKTVPLHFKPYCTTTQCFKHSTLDTDNSNTARHPHCTTALDCTLTPACRVSLSSPL